jgi:hypothetical protein
MGTAWLLRPLLARPDDDRGAPPLPGFSSARETVLNGPDYLRDILAFVPPDSFRLVAPVSKTFRRQYLAAHHNSTRTLLLHAAATPRTAQLWLDDGRPVKPLAVLAARWDRLDVLQCLHDGGRRLTLNRFGCEICVAAAFGGHLHVLEWALTNELAVWNVSMSNAAAQNGHLHVLRFAQARAYPMSAAEDQFCQGYPWDESTCAAAARGSQLHVLQWLRLNGCPWDESTCAAAARGSQLHVLQWLRLNGCPWDKYTCAEAAHGGQLHVLQWLRSNGCPWDKWTCFWAAVSGHLHMLQWAIANGCPWDVDDCLQAAVRQCHTEIVEWINSDGMSEFRYV